MPLSGSKAAAEAEPTIVQDVPGFVLASYRNVLVAIWGAAGTATTAGCFADLSSSLERANRSGFSSLHVIVQGAGLPDAATREVLGDVLTRSGKKMGCLGVVIDGDGFWASAIRSFLTGIKIIARRPYKSHYAATIGELARWVPVPHAAKTGVQLSSEEVERVMLEVRSRLRT